MTEFYDVTPVYQIFMKSVALLSYHPETTKLDRWTADRPMDQQAYFFKQQIFNNQA